MVVLGLMISIPIMVFGSKLIIKLMDRFPFIISLGAAIIAFTAGKMITSEPLLASFLSDPVLKYSLIALVTAGVLLIGQWKKQKTCSAK
ncbi:Integral membrane protein TerC [Dehalobacter sp. UNSWDHB]|jgi:Membrane protein TerC, possibly involved in tellurium resistance|nr:Integral membrane protein TerC [Dehalobacter sp. DCA]AFV06755.1 Integral membrane protein TerC [Dehalobacter sp. CF]EQB20333.1 Integral membrane protein TerC [Dehalobacter sp. UNSWDHB]